MKLEPFDKLILIMPMDDVKYGMVVGIRKEKNSSESYTIEPRARNFAPLKNGRLIKINSRDIGKEILIKKHRI